MPRKLRATLGCIREVFKDGKDETLEDLKHVNGRELVALERSVLVLQGRQDFPTFQNRSLVPGWDHGFSKHKRGWRLLPCIGERTGLECYTFRKVDCVRAIVDLRLLHAGVVDGLHFGKSLYMYSQGLRPDWREINDLVVDPAKVKAAVEGEKGRRRRALRGRFWGEGWEEPLEVRGGKVVEEKFESVIRGLRKKGILRGLRRDQAESRAAVGLESDTSEGEEEADRAVRGGNGLGGRGEGERRKASRGCRATRRQRWERSGLCAGGRAGRSLAAIWTARRVARMRKAMDFPRPAKKGKMERWRVRSL